MSPTMAASGSQNTINILMTDGFRTVTYPITINAKNLPPTFASLPIDHIINAGDMYSYKLPNFDDPEN